MTGEASELEETGTSAEALEGVEDSLEPSKESETASESVSNDETAVEISNPVEYVGDVLYTGRGGEAFEESLDGEATVTSVDPRGGMNRSESVLGANPADTEEVNRAIEDAGLGAVTYVIDSSFAEVLSYNDWETEVDARAAVMAARDWAQQLSGVGELNEIVITNDLYDEHSAPVEFEMGDRYDGSETDIVPRAVIDTFVNTLKMEGWTTEYREIGERAEIYMAC